MEIRLLSLSMLTEEERKALLPLFPSHSLSFEESKNSKLIACAAFYDSLPVGIIVSSCYPAIGQGLLKHYFVLPEYREKGVGTHLMQTLLNHLHDLKIRSLEIHFNASSLNAPSLQHILKESGWSNPQLLTTRYFFDLHIFNPPWLNNPPQLKKGEELFFLKDLTPDEASTLKRWDKENPLLHLLSPFDDDYPLENLNSMGLRIKGELAGWLATHRIDNRIIRYSSLYLHPEHRGTGSAIALLAASIAIHKEKETNLLGLTEINELNTPLYWKRFVEKRLASESTKLEEIKISHIFDF